MSGPDPGINSKDPSNCLYMEANPGDGGTHNAAGVWWLSPDVVMTGADPSKANPAPTPNTTNVTIHWKTGCDPFSGLPEDLQIVVFDLYIGDPTLSMTPGFPAPGGNLKSLTIAQTVSGITQGGSVTTAVNWTASSTAGDPDYINGIQHKCMLARCYPFGATPDAGTLKSYPPVDPHYAQRNLVVVGVGGEKGIRVPIKIGNPGERPEPVRIQARADLRPTRLVLDAVLPSLKATRGFKQVASAPLSKISFDLSNLGGARKDIADIFRELEREVVEIADRVEDRIEKVVTGKDEAAVASQRIEAHVSLAPKSVSTFDLVADPAGAARGGAHIYHLTQENSKRQPQGGLTVVFVIL